MGGSEMQKPTTTQISLRLPDDLMQLLDERASAEHLTRTDITAAALRAYLGASSPLPQSDKLDRVIELLETIAGAASSKSVIHRKPSAPIETQTITPPVTQRKTMRANDLRFHAVNGEADEMIVTMSGQGAGLVEIADALNSSGYTTATGQEWNRSRVRDYRHKLRDRGLLNG
jgi:hypothetical protein